MSCAVEVGLCFDCRWMRATTNRQGSTFYRCLRAEDDARFTKYPPLPVRACPGFEVTTLFIVLMHYIKPLPEVDAVRAEHWHYLERLAAEGVMRAWARRDPAAGGVLIAAAPDRASLEELVARDPYVTAGVARPEIVSFDPKNVRYFANNAAP